jgi:hypothetical protein
MILIIKRNGICFFVNNILLYLQQLVRTNRVKLHLFYIIIEHEKVLKFYEMIACMHGIVYSKKTVLIYFYIRFLLSTVNISKLNLYPKS